MIPSETRRWTILHFGTDRGGLLWRAQALQEMGYAVVNANDGFEAIQLASLKQVDALVLDLDRNQEEVCLIVSQIRRRRPHLPLLLLTDGTTPGNAIREIAGALVPRRDNVGMLIATLENVLGTGALGAASDC